MKITILTLFPEMFDSYLNTSIIKRAIAKGLVDYQIINIRDYTANKYNRVDDYPTGGGAGLIMQCQPVIDALKSANVPGKIALVLPEDIPFSYQNAIEGLLTIQKPLIATTLHQLIKDAHKEQMQTVVPKVEIRSENETYYVPLEQIIYAQEINHFVYVHLDNGSTLTMLGEIRDFYRWVNNHKEFVHIKKDTVLNLNHVISSSKKEYHMSNGEVITLPRFSFLKPQQ